MNHLLYGKVLQVNCKQLFETLPLAILNIKQTSLVTKLMPIDLREVYKLFIHELLVDGK